jgi:hypothetical protein
MQKSSFIFLHQLLAIIFVTCLFLLGKVHFSVASEPLFVYDSKEKRDPFISLIGKNVKLTDVELLESIDQVRVEGVIIDPNKGSSAIVNGQIIRVGEFLGGFRLEKVTNYHIVMKRDEQEHTIQFRSPEDDKQ